MLEARIRSGPPGILMTVLLLVTLLATAGLPSGAPASPPAAPAGRTSGADALGILPGFGSLDSLASPGAFRGNLFSGFS
jgi:hypothetical protein